MLLDGLQALLASPLPGSPLAAGLAVVAVVALIALAVAAVPVLPPAPAGPRVSAAGRRSAGPLPRSLDPDAAGRPRPRAPDAYPRGGSLPVR